jgi:spermidine/putrescine transport system substrate-binding protein
MLRGVGALGASGFLSACGAGGADNDPDSQDRSAKERLIVFSAGPHCVDTAQLKGRTVRPTLDAFVRASSVKVRYAEDITDEQRFAAQIRPAMTAGKSIDRDLIVVSDWMATRLMRLGWAQKFEHVSMPNIKYLLPALQDSPADPQRNYTLPWRAGVTGIVYNSTLLSKPVRTMKQLLTAPELKGRAGVLTELRDTTGLVLRQSGKSTNAFTDDDFTAVLGVLRAGVDSGQIRAIPRSQYSSSLRTGKVVACVARSTDFRRLRAQNPAFRFVVPEAGGLLWSDDAMVPKGARHQANAEALLNYYYAPKVAAKLAIALGHICPVAGAQDDAENRALAQDPLLFPDDAALRAVSHFKQLDEATERAYTEKFKQALAPY